jgi:hypothetical protein
MAKRKPTSLESEAFDSPEYLRRLAIDGYLKLKAQGRLTPEWEGDLEPSLLSFAEMTDAERCLEMKKNAERTRLLALKGLADLERRKQQGV